ncbi:protein aurora borealis [Musca domestica]|uniref:Protein aurora borealis n=1 Tax=Musca domestica TaxID=7370 RepID=A0ABM3VHG4_MUSDO|nr:protein aurora borealis [Musca domestica]XP_058985232.1 protein aurora borealis [Musca domestica]
MEGNDHETPQKLKGHRFMMHYPPTASDECNKVTPKNKQFRKSINPRTPQGLSYSLGNCNTMMSSNSSNGLHSISMAVIQTPPAKRHQKIKNPFEAAWAERLHMPLIASPSLFQRPDTPQMSSTQCEWTIEEVSSLMPANVEPHETQFNDSPDPELEAKAQMAISSYFKDNQIVPSPVDCPLRSQRIVLHDVSGNTPISKPGRRIRDCASQTELTLPPILPAALEEALKPYFQPHLAGANIELKKSRYAQRSLSSSIDAKDTSLRRKLFDIHNVLIWENEQQLMAKNNTSSAAASSGGQSNSSPHSLQSLQHTAIVGKLSDSLDKSSFGSLSPISASDDLSPSLPDKGSATKRKSRFNNFRSEIEELEQLSPIHPPVRRKPIEKLYRSQNMGNQSNDMTNNTSQDTDNGKFTPERSSSPLASMITNNIGEFSSDSFNIKVSRLRVNSSKCSNKSNKERLTRVTGSKNSSNILQEVDVFMSHEDTCEELLEYTGIDVEDMQISQVSAHSSTCSSSQSDTPRGKRRSASRKNLSQSFSANWLNDEGDENEDPKRDEQKLNRICQDLKKKNLNPAALQPTSSSSFGGVVHHTPINSSPKKSLTFYRTDSGFNEMSQNSSESQDGPGLSQQQTSMALAATDGEPMMVHCCSTPSTKQDKFELMI